MRLIRKRTWCRFSLRTLLILTAALAVLLGLTGNEARRLRLHRQAEERVHQLGGRCGSVVDGMHEKPRGPWWCPVVESGMYADNEYVWFTSSTNAGLRDDDLAVLEHFPRLRALQIVAPLITDEALTHIRGIKSLREFELYQTQVTKRGLERMQGIPLEMLGLGGTEVTDETLAALEAFPSLRKLLLSETAVTDAGLAHLRHVPRLEKLYLADSPICDLGMGHLAKLTRLHELNLIGLQVTDEGVEPLAGLPGLRDVYLVDTSLTETGLMAFRHTPTLKCLNVAPLAPDTDQALTSALPGCRIFGGRYRCMQGW